MPPSLSFCSRFARNVSRSTSFWANLAVRFGHCIPMQQKRATWLCRPTCRVRAFRGQHPLLLLVITVIVVIELTAFSLSDCFANWHDYWTQSFLCMLISKIVNNFGRLGIILYYVYNACNFTFMNVFEPKLHIYICFLILIFFCRGGSRSAGSLQRVIFPRWKSLITRRGPIRNDWQPVAPPWPSALCLYWRPRLDMSTSSISLLRLLLLLTRLLLLPATTTNSSTSTTTTTTTTTTYKTTSTTTATTIFIDL